MYTDLPHSNTTWVASPLVQPVWPTGLLFWRYMLPNLSSRPQPSGSAWGSPSPPFGRSSNVTEPTTLPLDPRRRTLAPGDRVSAPTVGSGMPPIHVADYQRKVLHPFQLPHCVHSHAQATEKSGEEEALQHVAPAGPGHGEVGAGHARQPGNRGSVPSSSSCITRADPEVCCPPRGTSGCQSNMVCYGQCLPCRYLKAMGITSHRAARVPMLTKAHMRKRLQFANRMMTHDWTKVCTTPMMHCSLADELVGYFE